MGTGLHMIESRYIANDFSPLLALDDADRHLKQALESIVTDLPPRYEYPILKGFWCGPTGFAYLFLRVSSQYPDLKVCGLCPLDWAKKYIEGDRSDLPLDQRCGIGCERLTFLAVRAAIFHDHTDVQELIATISSIVKDDRYPNEVLQGRSGTLYLLRMLRHWCPSSTLLVEETIDIVTQAILADGQDWKWHGRRYLGAVHGDIGIITQLILTTPSLAPQLEGKLVQVLDMQLPNGNWSSSLGKESSPLVQFCHGAPGFLHSLVVLRQYFPNIQDKIDKAIKHGHQCIWKEGLLIKEPSICHGIFGNALALPPGTERDHCLALATPMHIATIRKKDPRMFEPADYGNAYAAMPGYHFSAAWSWLARQASSGLIFYTDL